MPRPSSRCKSCKQLRIACDKARPSCEYCVATGRVCQYDEPRRRVDGSRTKEITPQGGPLEASESIGSNVQSIIDENWTDVSPYNHANNGLVQEFNDLELENYGQLTNVNYYPMETDQTSDISSYYTPGVDEFQNLEEIQSIEEIPRSESNMEIYNGNSLFEAYSQNEGPSGFGGYIYEQMRLNSVSKQLNIDMFELRLLKAFNTLQLKDALEESGNLENFNPAQKLWIIEVPHLWKTSFATRQGIYCLSSLMLTQRKMLDSVVEVTGDFYMYDTSEDDLSLVNSEVGEIQSPSGADRDNTIMTRYNKQTKILSYFGVALNSTSEMIIPILEEGSKLDEQKALECVIVSALLSSFLMSNPFKTVPLISFKTGESDYVGFVRSLIPLLDNTLDVLKDTTYSGAHYNNEKAYPEPLITDRFIIIEELRRQLQFYKSVEAKGDHNNAEDYMVIHEAIHWFERALNRSNERHNPLPVVRLLFYFEPSMFDLMHQQHYFCLKILYFFSCLVVVCELVFEEQENIWKDYVEWFVQYSKGNIHWHPFDQDFYELVAKKVHFNSSDFTNFDPVTLLKEYKTSSRPRFREIDQYI